MSVKSDPTQIPPQKARKFIEAMLGWYDENRRDIPWRALPGVTPDPYHVWLSEIMCQQTTVQAVIPYFLKFIERWPGVTDLAHAEREDVMEQWAGLGYYARARNLHKCAQVVAFEMGGIFPYTQDALIQLPGIGDYTSAAIAAIAFGQCTTVVDGNVERVMSRYCAINDPLPKSKPLLKKVAHSFFHRVKERPGDFAQSLMDLGARICTPKSPKCMLCPVRSGCAGHALGLAETLPKKEKKKPKPHKLGYVYWVYNNEGAFLVEQRGDREMLGGMPGFPCTDWVLEDERGALQHLFQKKELMLVSDKTISHSFTHFDLTLQICEVMIEKKIRKNNAHWHDIEGFDGNKLPTLFKKVWKIQRNIS